MKQFFSIILLLILVPLSASWAETLSVDKESTLSESNQSSILLQGENNLDFEKRPVKVNEAFKLSAISVDENTIAVRWIVKENYYLYKDKISFSVKGATIKNALFPKSKLKVDEFFGEVNIYNSSVEVILSLTDIVSNKVILTVEHQGCWEGGVCYPPQSDTIQVDFNGTQAFSSQDNSQITKSEKSANEKFQQGGLTLLIAAFLAGLALSWTPCVYPNGPNTVWNYYWTKESSKHSKSYLNVGCLRFFNVSRLCFDWSDSRLLWSWHKYSGDNANSLGLNCFQFNLSIFSIFNVWIL